MKKLSNVRLGNIIPFLEDFENLAQADGYSEVIFDDYEFTKNNVLTLMQYLDGLPELLNYLDYASTDLTILKKYFGSLNPEEFRLLVDKLWVENCEAVGLNPQQNNQLNNQQQIDDYKQLVDDIGNSGYTPFDIVSIDYDNSITEDMWAVTFNDGTIATYDHSEEQFVDGEYSQEVLNSVISRVLANWLTTGEYINDQDVYNPLFFVTKEHNELFSSLGYDVDFVESNLPELITRENLTIHEWFNKEALINKINSLELVDDIGNSGEGIDWTALAEAASNVVDEEAENLRNLDYDFSIDGDPKFSTLSTNSGNDFILRKGLSDEVDDIVYELAYHNLETSDITTILFIEYGIWTKSNELDALLSAEGISIDELLTNLNFWDNDDDVSLDIDSIEDGQSFTGSLEEWMELIKTNLPKVNGKVSYHDFNGDSYYYVLEDDITVYLSPFFDGDSDNVAISIIDENGYSIFDGEATIPGKLFYDTKGFINFYTELAKIIFASVHNFDFDDVENEIADLESTLTGIHNNSDPFETLKNTNWPDIMQGDWSIDVDGDEIIPGYDHTGDSIYYLLDNGNQVYATPFYDGSEQLILSLYDTDENISNFYIDVPRNITTVQEFKTWYLNILTETFNNWEEIVTIVGDEYGEELSEDRWDRIVDLLTSGNTSVGDGTDESFTFPNDGGSVDIEWDKSDDVVFIYYLGRSLGKAQKVNVDGEEYINFEDGVNQFFIDNNISHVDKDSFYSYLMRVLIAENYEDEDIEEDVIDKLTYEDSNINNFVNRMNSMYSLVGDNVWIVKTLVASSDLNVDAVIKLDEKNEIGTLTLSIDSDDESTSFDIDEIHELSYIDDLLMNIRNFNNFGNWIFDGDVKFKTTSLIKIIFGEKSRLSNTADFAYDVWDLGFNRFLFINEDLDSVEIMDKNIEDEFNIVNSADLDNISELLNLFVDAKTTTTSYQIGSEDFEDDEPNHFRIQDISANYVWNFINTYVDAEATIVFNGVNIDEVHVLTDEDSFTEYWQSIQNNADELGNNFAGDLFWWYQYAGDWMIKCTTISIEEDYTLDTDGEGLISVESLDPFQYDVEETNETIERLGINLTEDWHSSWAEVSSIFLEVVTPLGEEVEGSVYEQLVGILGLTPKDYGFVISNGRFYDFEKLKRMSIGGISINPELDNYSGDVYFNNNSEANSFKMVSLYYNESDESYYIDIDNDEIGTVKIEDNIINVIVDSDDLNRMEIYDGDHFNDTYANYTNISEYFMNDGNVNTDSFGNGSLQNLLGIWMGNYDTAIEYPIGDVEFRFEEEMLENFRNLDVNEIEDSDPNGAIFIKVDNGFKMPSNPLNLYRYMKAIGFNHHDEGWVLGNIFMAYLNSGYGNQSAISLGIEEMLAQMTNDISEMNDDILAEEGGEGQAIGNFAMAEGDRLLTDIGSAMLWIISYVPFELICKMIGITNFHEYMEQRGYIEVSSTGDGNETILVLEKYYPKNRGLNVDKFNNISLITTLLEIIEDSDDNSIFFEDEQEIGRDVIDIVPGHNTQGLGIVVYNDSGVFTSELTWHNYIDGGIHNIGWVSDNQVMWLNNNGTSTLTLLNELGIDEDTLIIRINEVVANIVNDRNNR